MRKQNYIISDRAKDLSVKLERPAEEIRGKGLSAYDFSPNRRVRVNFDDGSYAEFKFAFSCINEESSRLAIFTEYCGYHEYCLVSDMEVIEIDEKYYRHE